MAQHLTNIGLNRLGGFALLNHNIYIVVDSAPVNVDHAAHAGCNNVKWQVSKLGFR